MNAQSLTWAKTMGAKNSDAAYSIATDAAGNTYVTGYFQDTVDFNPGTGVFNLISQGGYDVFIQKLDVNGNFVWAQSFGSTAHDFGKNIKVGLNGDIVVYGTFNGIVDFDSSPATATLSSTSSDDPFVVRLSNLGTFEWVRHFGVYNAYGPSPLCIDILGNVYAGYGGSICKFDSLGSIIWSKTISGSFTDHVESDLNGNVIVSGAYQSLCDLDPGPGTQTVLPYGYFDYYIVKLDCNGNYIWGNSYGSPERDGITDLAVNSNGEIFFGSYINAGCATIDLDAGAGVYNYSGCGGYFVKLGTSGNFLWATNLDIPYRINLINNTIQWIANYSAGNEYLKIYSSSGVLQQSIYLNSQQVMAISSHTTGVMYLSGQFTGTANLAPGSGTFTVNTNSNVDAFVSKISYCDMSVPDNTVQLCMGNPQTLTASGLFSYTWQPGNYNSSSFTVNPTSSTIYTVSGTSGTCAITKTVMVVVNANISPSVSATAINPQICQGNTTSILGTGGNSYIFTPSIFNGQIITPTSSVVYTVVATNTTNACKNSATISIVVNPLPTITVISSTNQVCSSGTVNLIANGATTYSWSNGSSGNSVIVTPTANTNYSVSGSNSVGCVSASSAVTTVSVFTKPLISVNSGNICTGKSFTINASGASTYTYSSGSNVVSPTVTTTYSVTGTSAQGCVSSNTAVSSVGVFSLPVVALSNGTMCSGQVFTLIPSGASTYTYSSGSATVSPGSTSSYSVSGTSAQGCLSSNTAVATVTVYNRPTISSNSGSVCSGQSFTITATGANTYTYSSGTNVITPASTSTYNVVGTSTNGCVSTNTAVTTVTVYTTPVISVSGGTLCSGIMYTLLPTGAVSYTYSSGTALVNPTTTTSYSVSGTSANGCISATPAVATVTVYNTPTLTVNSGSICSGQSFTITPSGASTYSYSSGGNLVNPSSTTVYSVVGTSTAGCVSSSAATSTVTVYALPIISIANGSVCSGQPYTLTPSGATNYTFSSGSAVVTPTTATSYTINGSNAAGCTALSPAIASVGVYTLPIITVSNGTICQGNSFTFTPSGAINYTYSSGSAVVNPTANSTYSVTGVNVFGCVSASAVVATVTVNQNPTVTVNSGSICTGQSFTLNPTGASTYTVSGGALVVNPTSTSNYTVTGTSAQGCTGNVAVATVTVNVLPTLAVNSGSICTGQSFTLNPTGASTYTVSGGVFVVSPTITTSYSISGTSIQGCQGNAVVASLTVMASPLITVNSGSICSGQSFTITPSGALSYTYSGNSAVVNPTTTTSYTVTGINAQGCVGVPVISSVTVEALPVITVNSGAICKGQSFTLQPTGAATYSYSSGSAVVSPTTTTSYTISGTSAGGCQSPSFATSQVIVNSNPTLTVNNGTICSGSNFIIVPSGALNYTYSTGGPTVNPSSTLVYSVTGTNSAGCQSSWASGTVTVKPLPAVNISGLTDICKGDKAVLKATGAASYTWSTGESKPVIVVTPTTATVYSVTGVSTNGCINTQTVEITLGPCTGVSSLTVDKIKIYPIPTRERLYIEAPGAIEVDLINELGQVVLHASLEESAQLDVHELARGVYYVISKDLSIRKKVVLD